ncbi:unnamed protein product [Oppiella nova]|uniref:Uncharacterized protein n=1 Tax=Oppiella nova TaxID=334625 RepID=A0A7R9MD30_9ACAR|nr:unnamed protein product [Oppiella nova]CAG2175116.1 unnamed protein product [Oppiella nova]
MVMANQPEARMLGPVGDFLGHFPGLGFMANHPGARQVVRNNGDFTAANAAKMPNSVPGKSIRITPDKTTTMTIYKRIVCTGGPVQEIMLNTTIPNSSTTCNGYDAWVSPWTYNTVVNGQAQDLVIGNFSQYYSYLNGNMYEVNFGQITGGDCAGDTFFSANAYVADDQLGCSGQGLKSVSIDYINAKISGTKCNQQCTLDTRHHSFFAYNPPITN